MGRKNATIPEAKDGLRCKYKEWEYMRINIEKKGEREGKRERERGREREGEEKEKRRRHVQYEPIRRKYNQRQCK